MGVSDVPGSVIAVFPPRLTWVKRPVKPVLNIAGPAITLERLLQKEPTPLEADVPTECPLTCQHQGVQSPAWTLWWGPFRTRGTSADNQRNSC